MTNAAIQRRTGIPLTVQLHTLSNGFRIVTEAMPGLQSASIGLWVGAGGRHPTYTRMLAGDGLWFGCGALGPKFETALLGALGLSDMLKEQGIECARRTVAKYREGMRIAPASLRKAL